MSEIYITNGAMTNLRSDDSVAQMTAEDKEYAATYLNETDNNRAHAIAQIKRWITENDEFCAPTDDTFILGFLRTCKFNIENTKIRIRNYIQQRTNVPEWYANRDPLLPEVQEFLKLGTFLPLRKPDDQGRMITLVRPHLYDPCKLKLAGLTKVAILIMDIERKYQMAGTLRGTVLIVDIKDITFRHTMEMGLNVLRNIVHSWHKCYPIRVKAMKFINMSTFMSVILTIFRKFMTEKMQRRFHIYARDTENNWAKEFPAEILPVEYGGTDCTVQELTEYWKKMVEENRDWLIEDEKYRMISRAK